MKHKHYEMIVAKAANMDLVSFIKFGEEWMLSAPHEAGVIITFDDRYDYFLCLPKHKDACLQWLNGGDVQSLSDDKWFDVLDWSYCWSVNSGFMQNDFTTRIKPKKEKRWIGVYGNHVTDGMYPTKELCERCVNRLDKFKYTSIEGWQFIEIEVEV